MRQSLATLLTMALTATLAATTANAADKPAPKVPKGAPQPVNRGVPPAKKPATVKTPPAKAAGPKTAPAAPVDERRIVGDDVAKTAVGFYENPNWGSMLIEIDGDKFYGTYAYRMGTVKGTLDKSTGVVKAVWCEGNDETTNPRPYRGLAEFVFEKGQAGKQVDLKGKWKPGGDAATAWKEDWNLTKQTGTAPAELQARMKKKGSMPPFCDKP